MKMYVDIFGGNQVKLNVRVIGIIFIICKRKKKKKKITDKTFVHQISQVLKLLSVHQGQ